MARRPARTLHGLAEDIYEALDRKGFWDEDDDVRRPRSRRTRSGAQRGLRGTTRRNSPRVSRSKPKRKVSRYQKAFGACLKDLKRRHPRTSTTRLMKKAHVCARKKKREGGW